MVVAPLVFNACRGRCAGPIGEDDQEALAANASSFSHRSPWPPASVSHPTRRGHSSAGGRVSRGRQGHGDRACTLRDGVFAAAVSTSELARRQRAVGCEIEQRLDT